MATAGAKYAASCIENMLECCVCLDVVVDPHTLQECLHTLCKSCMQQLLEEQNNQPPGVHCPICRKFSGEDKIMSNFFIKELTDVHKSAAEEKVLCKQCQDYAERVEASCRCLDCREALCESCKMGHKKIKILRGHRIVDLTDDQDIVVDSLFFCDFHKDKQIELYCEPCQQLICITCKVTKHISHQSQTIDEALEKIIPEMEENAKVMDKNIHEIEKSAAYVQQKITETKESFQNCYQEIAAAVEAKKRGIEVIQKQMEARLKRKETKEIAKLQVMQEELEFKKKERENVSQVFRGSMDRARHVSLLRALVHNGLRDKVKKKTEPLVQLKVNKPQFSSNITKKHPLGTVVYSVISFYLTSGSVLAGAGSEVQNVDFKEYFSQTFKEMRQIKANGWCCKIKLINDALWIPLNDENKVNIFNLNGNLLKTVEINSPRSVAQANNGDTFIACSNQSGLYVMTVEGIPQLISTGSFADVYSHAGKVFALEHQNKSITEYLPVGSASRDVRVRWKTAREWAVDEVTGLLDKLVVTGGGEHQLFVSHYSSNTISEYNTQGQCIKQFGSSQETGDGNLYGPWLCGVDRQSLLLVADWGNNVYKILDPATGQWMSTCVRDERYVYDAKLDSQGNLWLCQLDSNYKYVITKHMPYQI